MSPLEQALDFLIKWIFHRLDPFTGRFRNLQVVYRSFPQFETIRLNHFYHFTIEGHYCAWHLTQPWRTHIFLMNDLSDEIEMWVVFGHLIRNNERWLRLVVAVIAEVKTLSKVHRSFKHTVTHFCVGRWS